MHVEILRTERGFGSLILLVSNDRFGNPIAPRHKYDIIVQSSKRTTNSERFLVWRHVSWHGSATRRFDAVRSGCQLSQVSTSFAAKLGSRKIGEKKRGSFFHDTETRFQDSFPSSINCRRLLVDVVAVYLLAIAL